MNNAKDNTAPAIAPAPVTMKDVYETVDAIWNEVTNLQRKAYLLSGELEDSLCPRRGKKDDVGLTLVFQERGIDVIQWLAGEVWADTVSVEKKTDALIRRLEGFVE